MDDFKKFVLCVGLTFAIAFIGVCLIVAWTYSVYVAFGLAGVTLLAATRWLIMPIIRDAVSIRTQVISDRAGHPVRAVIHKGELVQIAPGGMDITEIMKLQQQQVVQMQNYWKMFSTATTSMKNMAAFINQYGVVDAEEQDEVEELGTTQKALQIGAPGTDIITMHLSDDCTIPADDLLSGRKLICGISGSGKSNTVGSYGEELGKLGVPFVLGDTEDEYQPLCSPKWLKNGVLAGRGTRYDINVENAAKFGGYVLNNRLQVILNLQSYEMEEAALIMVGIIGGMREWEQALPNEDRIPCDFILEEAVTWLPQNISESPLYKTQTFNMLQNTFFNDMVRKGRKRGLGLTLVCQKIAELDKRAMQSDGKLLHRQTEPNDLARYAQFGIPKENTLSLADGECFLFTSHISGQRVQIRRRHSPHGAKTPGIANLNKQRNFDENSEISEPGRNDFGQVTEPLRSNISEFRKTVSTGQNQIPEETKSAILDLYQSGAKRTEIQDQLGINGDEYWMIKTVCNEYDRAKEA
jgi:hypothetical protein